ncbi:MAG: cobalt ECF transporter T component CbiQ [Anaerolineae bacterium]|nr:cobalt ECF transporter T component CbiQ [Anaerolineae bacterium]
MHVHLLDQYHRGESLVHRLDARLKVLLTLGFVIACSLTPAGGWRTFAALALLWLVSVLAARVPLPLLLRRSLVALPFALAAMTLLVTTPGAPLLRPPLAALTVTDAGLVAFLSVLLRSWLSLLMALLLSATTTFPDLLVALRTLRVPRTLVAVVAFMLRYLFVLGDEALRLLRAREARSAAAAGQRAGGAMRWRARVAGGMVGSLFLRSTERSERIFQAMASRGYQGEIRALTPPRLRPADVLVGLLFVLCLASAMCLKV